MNNFSELGIQRVLIWLANSWPLDSGDQLILVVHNSSGPLREQLAPHVKLVELDGLVYNPGFMRTPFRLLAYRRFLRQWRPDVVFGANQFESMLLSVCRKLSGGFRLVAAEHCNVTENLRDKTAYRGWFRLIYIRWFPRAYRSWVDCVQTVSDGAREDLISNHDIPAARVHRIYNPIDLTVTRKKALESVSRDHREEAAFVVTMASRLVAQKRVDIALDAWRQFMHERRLSPSDARLVILGDGDLRGELVCQAARLGIADSVFFEGFQSNPWKHMQRSHVFLSTSEWEGLPCSLIEAQALGVPVLASDCPSGPREILLDGEAGVLFPRWNVAACAEGLWRVYADSSLRERCVSNANKHLSRFSVDEIIAEYRRLAVSLQ